MRIDDTNTAYRTAYRLARVGLPLVAAGLLATACSSSGGGDGATSTAPGGGASSSSAAAARGSAPATGASSIMVADGHLTDGSGRTVYLWEADKDGKSSCSGGCAAVWAPVLATGTPEAGTGATATDLTTTTRTDGGQQLVYAGHPLYYFEADKSPGQANGQGSDGFGAKWWEVDGAGKAITATDGGGAPSTSTSTSTSSSASSSGGGGGGYGY